MATTTASRTNPSSSSRRSPPTLSPVPSLPTGTKTAPLRSTMSSRLSPSVNSSVVRRQSLKATPPSQVNGETRESLSSSLKHEVEKKEQLLVQLQNKDQTIISLTSENTSLSSALSAAETRINELYAEQSRVEDEMAARMEFSDKLREQIRELEREKRELQRRYNEQTTTFEAERQAFYDNEQHLKSRIQSLMQVRRVTEMTSPVQDEELEAEPDDEDDQHPHDLPQQRSDDPTTEPPEVIALRLELSTLSTSYASIQSTLVLLQTQLADLKRVNHELQEENESYMILLRERTLNGQYDISKQVAGAQSEDDRTDDDTDAEESVDVGSLRSFSRSTLDSVDETPEDSLGREFERVNTRDADSIPSTGYSRRHIRQGRKRGASDSPHGESLAGLPITGPGLDLAAELGRAENKDILEGGSFDSPDRPVADTKVRKGRKEVKKPNATEATPALESSPSSNDIEALRTEVKALKDANKALSLYASKIIDRIIAQEGFEHVLAVDYQAHTSPVSSLPTAVPPKSPVKKARPQSVIVGQSSSNPMESFRFGGSPPTAITKSPPAPAPATSAKANRRSLSFDWKSFSFGGSEKKMENPGLRPLTLKPGSSALTGARKLETVEDENDRRERERLNATMKLMGIAKPTSSPLVPPSPMQKSFSSPAAPPSSVSTATQSRFSWFRSNSSTAQPDTPTHSDSGISRSSIDMPTNLTAEALAQAEAEENLAMLDAHERALSAEIAKGASGGYTEIARLGDLRSRRSRRSVGSGSTVWSAGMGKGDDDSSAS